MSSRQSSSSPSCSSNGDQPSKSGSRWESYLSEARQGSREAQAQLLHAVRPYLLSLAEDQLASELRPRMAPSDIVQNTVLQAWEDFGNFRGQSRAELVGWLRAILCNNVIDGARKYRGAAKRDLRRERSVDQMVSEFGEALADSMTSPSGLLMASEEQQQMEQAVSRLSPKHEQAIRLRNDLGLSYAEVGVALSCSENAARKLWVRAIQELKQELFQNETEQR